MKLISWNVNGLRACLGKGFADFLRKRTPTCSAFRRPKCSRDRLNSRLRAIISTGTAPKKGLFRHGGLFKEEPLRVSYGLGLEEHDHEGRVITLNSPPSSW